jgi:hypothetical protein
MLLDVLLLFSSHCEPCQAQLQFYFTILLRNYRSPTDFLLKMDLLHSNAVTITINHPCLLPRKTLKQNYWEYLPSISFPFCIPVYLSVTHNHFTGVQHGTVRTAVPLLVTHRFCHSTACMTVHCSSINQVSTARTSVEPWIQHSRSRWPVPQQHYSTTGFTLLVALCSAAHINIITSYLPAISTLLGS